MAWGVRRVSPPPRSVIEPAVGARAPEMQLKQVVFPEPFGPMRPRISPSATSKETVLSAMNPPKRFVSAEIVSTVLFERRLCRRNSVAGGEASEGGGQTPPP